MGTRSAYPWRTRPTVGRDTLSLPTVGQCPTVGEASGGPCDLNRGDRPTVEEGHVLSPLVDLRGAYDYAGRGLQARRRPAPMSRCRPSASIVGQAAIGWAACAAAKPRALRVSDSITFRRPRPGW